MEREIIHVAFAYMNMQKIIIPSEEGQKNGSMSLSEALLPTCIHTHTTLSLYPLTSSICFLSVCHSLSLFLYLLYMMESDGGWL